MTTYNFPPTSRYYGVPIKVRTDEEGDQIPYLARRFLPSASSFAELRQHQVVEGERPDLIAAAELGDAEGFWRVADANDVMRPAELATPGRILRITLPEGIPGPPTA
jgi:hypothetical protein